MGFKAFLVSILILFSLLSPSLLHAQSATSSVTQSSSPVNFTIPQPQGTLQVEIPRAYFVKGILWADVQIKNDTQSDIYDLVYGIQVLSPRDNALSSGSVISNAGWLVGYQDSSLFDIKKGEALNQTIQYNLGSSFENGTYTLLFQVKGRDNQIVGYQTQTFPLVGNNRYLRLNPESCYLRIGSRVQDLSDGSIIDGNNPGSVVCEVINPTSENIQAKYKFEYNRWSVSNTQENKQSLDSPEYFTIAPNSAKELIFNLPVPEIPQVYQGFLSLVDEEGRAMTPIIIPRWTISGPSATILYINADKNSYSVGSEAQVRIGVTPSADLAWPEDPLKKPSDLDNALLKVTLLGVDNQVCGESVISLPKTSQASDWPEQDIKVKIENNCPNFVIKAEIINDGVILAKSEEGYGISAIQSSQNHVVSQIAARTGNQWWFLVGAIVVLIIICIALGGFFIRRRSKNNPPAPPIQQPPQPPISNVTPLLLMIALTALAIGYRGWNQVSAAVFDPVDPPIVNQTVKREGGRSFWGNASPFKTPGGTGRSDFTVNQDCTVGNFYIYGYADHAFCGNFRPGIHPQVFIDGQPVTIQNVQSPDSDITTSTICSGIREDSSIKCPPAHEFRLDAPTQGGGIRTGTATLSIPASVQTDGQHTIEVHVAAGGKHHMAGGGYIVESSFPNDYIKMTKTYSCNRCPVGQVNPHYVCDPTSKTCKKVDFCGVSTCTPGQNQCENCDNPNEIKPHKACVNNSCTTVAACGAPSCNTTADCCPAGQAYDPASDKCVTPACNVSCPDDGFCQKAGDGCTYCVKNQGSDRGSCQRCPNPGETNPHGTCDGVACRQVNTCGVTSCTADTQCYSDNMCKCDGLVADMVYPGNSFKFEAFGKVEGTDTQKAEIADITFRMTKDNQVIAKSDPIPPQIVESSADKVRFKAAWQTPPPAVSQNSVYRVFADVRCKPKRVSASGEENFTPKSQILVNQSKPPVGLKLIMDLVDKLSDSKDWIGRGVVGEVMAQLSSPSPSGNQSNLQLSTLNFVKLMDTDNCRFVMFKYDETLF